jgi:glycosyltransferase involved in cell wall biosynthesis
MKILLVNKYLYPKGGDAIYTIQLQRLLEKNGHEVWLWGMKHPENPDYPLEKYFVNRIDYDSSLSILKKIRNGLNVLYSFEAKKKIKRVLEICKPDIVHLNNIAHQLTPSIIDAVRMKRIPMIMTMHDYKTVCPIYTLFRKNKPCELCRGRRFFFCAITKCSKNSYIKSIISTIEMYLHHSILHIYENVNCFIGASNFLVQKVREMGQRSDCTQIPCFIDLAEYPDYSGMSKDNTIVYMGRLSAEKGLSTLIEAVQGLDIHLNLIGEGPMRPALEKQVESSGLGSQVTFMGYVSRKDAMEEVKKAMCCVYPSEWYETFSLATIEAFALGVPVISSRIGALPELVRDGVTGLTFRPGDADELREKLLWLRNHPERAGQMGKIGRGLVERNYSSEVQYPRLIEVYCRAIARQQASRVKFGSRSEMRSEDR